jgi:hypothetical protein
MGECWAVRLRQILKRLLAIIGVPLLVAPTPVSAQLVGIPQVAVPLPSPGPVPDPGPIGVLERIRPGVAPQGMQFGGTTVLPALTAGAGYDSNVFAAPSNPSSDVVFHIRPELTLDSGPRELAYRFTGYGDFVEYATNSQLSNQNGGALLGIRGDYTPTVVVESLTGFVYGHQDPSTFAISVPTNGTLPYLPSYTLFSEALTATHEVGEFGASLTGSFLRSIYQDVTINGVLVNNSAFNGNVYSISPLVSYLIAPPTRMYVQATFQRTSYDSDTIDSDTYTAVVGSAFEFRRLIRGNAYVGYKERVYDSSAFGSYGAFTWGLNAAWYPMEVLTVKLTGKQDYYDSAAAGPVIVGTSSSLSIVDAKTIQGQIDYEVSDRIILSAVAGYENDNYLNTSRIDGITKLGADFKYLLNYGASIDLLYLYSTRQSTQSAFYYDRQQVGIALRLQY